MRTKVNILFVLLFILAITTQSLAITALGSITTSASAKDIILMENFAIIAEGEYGVEIFDVSDPANPFLAETIESPGSAEGVYVYDTYIFVANGEAGFSVYHFNTFEAEANHVNTIETPGFCTDIMVSCDIAYIADGLEGMHTYHAFDPSQMDYLNSYDTPGYANNIFGPCGDINLADGESGFRFYAVAGPFELVYFGGYDSDGSVISLFPESNHVFVADSSNGLLVIDRSDLENQFLAASYETPGTVYDVFYNWLGTLYVADGESGVRIYDALDPTNLIFLDNFETQDMALGIRMWSNIAFVITESSLIIFEESTTGIEDKLSTVPENFNLVRNYPNPFNASTTISYSLETSSDVQIDIFDITGRLIETVADGYRSAGNHNLIWNAGEYSSGVYYYRLNADGGTFVSKMTLLK